MPRRTLNEPIQLLPVFRERVWGRESLAPFFPSAPEPARIGEAWFTGDENPTSIGLPLHDLLTTHPEILGSSCDALRPGTCPILVKLLFTSDRLSVQVHPDDEYATTHHHGSSGKTEAWCVLDAQPGAKLALGFCKPLTRDELKQAVESAAVEQLLDWRDAKPGDVFFVPAGTVHAIGAGLTLCEVQQNSDITYRLYDYGRARELHLEDGLNVARLQPHRCTVSPVPLDDWREELIACRYFRIERLRPPAGFEIGVGTPHYMVLVCVKGSGAIGTQYATAGTAWFIPAHGNAVRIDAPGSEWILTYTAEKPLQILH